MIRDTHEPAFDVFVLEEDRAGEGMVCLLGYSRQGSQFVATLASLGEAFGNGLLLDEAKAYIAFDAMDAAGLTTRTY